jgi:nicotinate-nucleotide adenylyltransferase
MKKIGLFGGTFDPIHNAHLIIAEYLREELDLDKIWFIPAKIHPLKSNTSVTREKYRLEMLKKAIVDNPYFQIEDLELKQKKTSYTISTIEELLNIYSQDQPKFYFFLGMDNINQLYRWKDPHRLIKICQLIGFGRPGFVPSKTAKQFLTYIKFVHTPLLEISSTMIRQRIGEGLSVRYFIPEAVNDYITTKGLYK